MGKSLPVSGLICVLLLAVFVSGIAAASPNNVSTAADSFPPGTKLHATIWNHIKWPGYDGEVRVRCVYKDTQEVYTLGSAYLRSGKYTIYIKNLDGFHVEYLRCEFLWNRNEKNLSYYVYSDDLNGDEKLETTWAITEPGLTKQKDDGTFVLVEDWF